MNTVTGLLRPLLALILVVLPALASADPVKEPWQSRREAGNAITLRACDGDASAIAEVKRQIEAGDPVMLNNSV